MSNRIGLSDVGFDFRAEEVARPARAKRGLEDFLFFCNYFCGFKDINREEHGDILDAWEEIFRLVDARRERQLEGKSLPEDTLDIKLHIEAARGTFKTSIDQAASIRMIVKDRQIAIRFNVNKVDNAEKKVEFMSDLLKSGRIPDHYGEFYSPGDWSKRSFRVVGNRSADPTVVAGGLDERQTSTHCDIIINSDMQDEANSLTQELRRGVEEWRSNELNLFRQKTCYRIEVWDSTRWHKHDIAGQLMTLADRVPKPKNVWVVCRPVADPGEWARDSRGCTLHFPNLFPREKIFSLFDAAKSGMREHDVWTQYFLDVSKGEHTKFKEEWLRPPLRYDPSAGQDSRQATSVCMLPKRLNLFVTIDPANADEIRKAREKGDFANIQDKCDTGMVLWGMDEQKHRVEFAAVSAQMSISEMGDQIVRWFRAYHMPDKRRKATEYPKFGPDDRAARNWTFKRVGVEKVVFSAGAIIEPLRVYLSGLPAMGPERARAWLNDHSAIQISTQKSKAGRQDATEVDWASGKVRTAQHQTDIDASIEHPLQTLIDAKKEYPNNVRWDVLDAESLGWGPSSGGGSFMFAPYDMMTDHEKFEKDLDGTIDAMKRLARPGPGDIDKYYRQEREKAKMGQVVGLHGPSEFLPGY